MGEMSVSMRLGLGIGLQRETLSSSAFHLSKKMICRAGTTQNRGEIIFVSPQNMLVIFSPTLQKCSRRKGTYFFPNKMADYCNLCELMSLVDQAVVSGDR